MLSVVEATRLLNVWCSESLDDDDKMIKDLQRMCWISSET